MKGNSDTKISSFFREYLKASPNKIKEEIRRISKRDNHFEKSSSKLDHKMGKIYEEITFITIFLF